MRQEAELTAFTQGEVSLRLKGRTDFKGYYNACESITNMVVIPQGGVMRRPGTIYAAAAKDQVNPVILVRFIFSVVQAYMLEFGQNYIRVYRNGGQVTNVESVTGAASNGGPNLIRLTVPTAGMYTGNTATVSGVGGVPAATGTWVITVIDTTHIDLVGSTFSGAYTSGGTVTVIVEIPTTYLAAELAALQFTQSADTLYICHPTHAPATLGRSSNTNWVLTTLVFKDGPYLSTNTTATTLACSGVSGSVTVTASSIVGINATTGNTGQGFLSTDVGRLIRFNDGTQWGWLVITAFTDTTHVTATVQAEVANGASSPLNAGTATILWALGKWSATTGYPWVPTFWQQRLMFAGTNNQPNAVEGSQTADFTNFAASNFALTVVANNAVSWVISDDQVNAARWMSTAGSAQTMQLGIGTDGSEEIMESASAAQALSPTSVQVYRETVYGSLPNCNALRIGKSILFATADGRKIYDWAFSWQVNGYIGVDRTVDSEHITKTGLVDMIYQKSPINIVWAIRNDGELIGMTYLVEQQVIAWHHHVLGGQYYGGPPIVESLTCIPDPTGTYDQLWLSVLRTINGVPTRNIEVMSAFFDNQPQEQAFFVDCGLSSTLTFPAATCTPSAFSGTGTTFTATAGTPFASGNVGSLLRINGGVAVIRTFVSSTVITGDWYTNATSTAPALANAWSLTAQSASFSGAGYLAGETVEVYGDGADMGQYTAANSITLSNGQTATYASIGLPYTFKLIGMPFEPIRAAAAISQGKIKRVDHLWLRLYNTLGCSFGVRQTDPMTQVITEKVEPMNTRSAGNPVGQPPPLVSAIYRLPVPGGYDREMQLEITGSGPYPCTVLAMIAKGDTGGMPGPG